MNEELVGQLIAFANMFLIVGAFFMKDKESAKLLQKSISNMLGDFKAIWVDKDDHQLRMTSVLTNPASGVEVTEDKVSEMPTPQQASNNVMVEIHSLVKEISERQVEQGQDMRDNRKQIIRLSEKHGLDVPEHFKV